MTCQDHDLALLRANEYVAFTLDDGVLTRTDVEPSKKREFRVSVTLAGRTIGFAGITPRPAGVEICLHASREADTHEVRSALVREAVNSALTLGPSVVYGFINRDNQPLTTLVTELGGKLEPVDDRTYRDVFDNPC